jgi:hypothetical protein
VTLNCYSSSFIDLLTFLFRTAPYLLYKRLSSLLKMLTIPPHIVLHAFSDNYALDKCDSRHSLVVEHPPCKRKVVGSIPTVGSLFPTRDYIFLRGLIKLFFSCQFYINNHFFIIQIIHHHIIMEKAKKLPSFIQKSIRSGPINEKFFQK